MSAREEIEAARDAMQARLDAATLPPWGLDRYGLAGIKSEMFGEGRCANCGLGEPMWSGRANINGRVMDAHEHIYGEGWLASGRIIAGEPGHRVMVALTTDEYGEMDDDDRDLVIAAVNREQRVIDHVTNVLARHHEAVHDPRDSCRNYGSGCCAGCGKFDVGTHRYTVTDCPEVASVHAMVVGP